MFLAGFQKLTLIDYPGKLAATVFTQGCNFSCPFCHNPELVINIKKPTYRTAKQETRNKKSIERDFFALLKKRKGKLEGVCITGGEPTIQSDLSAFIKKIKKLGYLVKLDSNGSNPEVIEKLIDEKLLDYIAMDIKNTPRKYFMTSGKKANLVKIKKSVELIKKSGVDHEFRTTVVPGLHSETDFLRIGKWLAGSGSYFLQRYREEKILDPKLKIKTKGKSLDLEKISESIKKYFKKVAIRE